MKKWLVGVLLLFLLVGCSDDELPPSPPPPGGDVSSGLAMGGIPIPSGQIPAKYTAMDKTDISPTVAKFGDTITITVDNVDYAYAIIYVVNKFNMWEKVYADTSLSGKITKDWAKNRAVFKIQLRSEKLAPGMLKIISYGCIDTDKRNEQGYKIWDCNKNSNKWGLGSAEISTDLYAELIQKPIENNDYVSASKSTVADGVLFTANYKHKYSGVKTDVSVLELSNVNNFKQMLRTNIAVFEPLWNLRSQQVCGFLKSDAVNKVSEYSWISSYGGKNYWLTVKTLSTVIDDAKITAYIKYRYPTDCNLLNELKQQAQPYCGNGVKDTAEQCDMKDDSACPGACRPDCYCMPTSAVAGTCGDCAVNPGEQCEPQGVVDILGQIKSGSPCWVKNLDGSLTEGHCNPNCMCDAGKVSLPKCGNGLCENDESQASCPQDCCGGAQPPAAVACTDTDDENYYYKGTVTRKGAVDTVEVDNCVDANKLEEMVCTQDYPKEVNCPYGCDNGICKAKLAPTTCPDALSVWSHDDKINGRNIWFSAYWDVPVWAVKSNWKKSTDVVTGEAQSLAILLGDDNDPDIATWAGQGGCGNGIVVWSNVPGVVADVAKVEVGIQADVNVIAVNPGALAVAKAGVPNVMYSIWNDGTGWDAPKLVAPNGYDPAVDVDAYGKAVAVWVGADGIYASVYTGSWSSPVKIGTGAAGSFSLPQITHNYALNKWIAAWISSDKVYYAVFDGSSWSAQALVAGQTGKAMGGSLILPITRLHVDSQWSGPGNTVAWHREDAGVSSVMWAPLLAGVGGVETAIFSPDVDYDFYWDNFHVIGKGNSRERYFDGGFAVADGPNSPYLDGRPAHTYVRISNNDVAVWHSEDESNPYMPDIFWSRRDGLGWSVPVRLVTTGLNSYDRNADIAPLFSFTSETRTLTDSPTRPPTTTSTPGKIWNPPGFGPGAGAGPPPGGGGPPPGGGGGGGGNGGGDGGGNGGGSGGGVGGGQGEWGLSGGCSGNCPTNCPAGLTSGSPCTIGTPDCNYNQFIQNNMINGQVLHCGLVGKLQEVGTCVLPSCPVQCCTALNSECVQLLNTKCVMGTGAPCIYRSSFIGSQMVGGILECTITQLSTGPSAPVYDQPFSGSTYAGSTLVSDTSGNALVSGQAIYSGDASSSDVTNLALFLIAGFGILVVTLVNFVHRDE